MIAIHGSHCRCDSGRLSRKNRFTGIEQTIHVAICQNGFCHLTLVRNPVQITVRAESLGNITGILLTVVIAVSDWSAVLRGYTNTVGCNHHHNQKTCPQTHNTPPRLLPIKLAIEKICLLRKSHPSNFRQPYKYTQKRWGLSVRLTTPLTPVIIYTYLARKCKVTLLLYLISRHNDSSIRGNHRNCCNPDRHWVLHRHHTQRFLVLAAQPHP